MYHTGCTLYYADQPGMLRLLSFSCNYLHLQLTCVITLHLVTVYQVIIISFNYCSLDRACYPEELTLFVQNTEAVSTSGNESKGEGMDACLEEKNKESKVWQHGTMTALDWLRIFRNLENLSKVCGIVFVLLIAVC